jgi:hypothetical protein
MLRYWVLILVVPFIAKGQFFQEKTGEITMADGSIQSFNGFRCRYTGGLLYTTNAAIAARDIKQYWMTFPKLILDMISRVEFQDSSDRKLRSDVRSAILTYNLNTKSEKLYVVAQDCSWAEFDSDKIGADGKPSRQGDLSTGT